MGKKSGPSQPQAPDPVKTAQAQSQQNKDAAIAQANLNRIDQYTPQGSSTYSQVGTNPDGTPRYAQTTQYSAAEQQKYDQGNKVAFGLNDLAISNMGRVADTQGKDFNFDGMTPQTTSVGGGLPGIDYGGNENLPGLNYGTGAVPAVKYGDSTGQPGVKFGDNSGLTALKYANNNNLPGIKYGTGAANATQTGIADQGKAQAMPFGMGGQIQNSLDYGGLTKLPGTQDFGAEGQKMADSVYGQYASRLNPRFQQGDSDMRARLAAQGISENSDAYRREADNFSRDRNDAYGQAAYQAQQAGAGEQSRLFGLAMGARQQGQNEVNTQGNFANAAQNQGFGQTGQVYDRNNQAQAQNYGQAVGIADLFNRAQGQDFNQNQSAQAFANTAQGQQFAQNQAETDQYNRTQGQQFAQNQSGVDQFNRSQGQQYDQNQTALDQFNRTQGQQYEQNQQTADFFNRTQGQQFAQNQSMAGFRNAARGQAFNEQGANATLANQGRQQQIAEASYLRNLPLNEIAALMGTAGGVSDPNFQSVAQVGVAAPDYQGLVQNQYQAQQNQYNQRQAARSQALGSIASTAGMAASMFMSDRRLKWDIHEVGKLANGIKTYVFKYLGDTAQHFGVMAQEVLKVRPDAVGLAPDGYLFVDYGKVL